MLKNRGRKALKLASKVLQKTQNSNESDRNKLPTSQLSNLIYGQEAGREARHVTIAISGFLSKDSDQ